MKNKNLKIIVGVEIALIVCLCLCGIGGIVYYSGNLQAAAGGGQPPTQPAAEATATPLPTETPVPVLLGTELERLADGGSKFSDLDGGYEMNIPAGWLAVRPDNNDEINAALVGEGAKNQMLFDRLAADKAAYEANADRLFVYTIRPDLQENVIFGFSKLIWDGADTQPIDNATMGRLVRDLEASGGLPGLRVRTSVIEQNPNGVSLMVIKGRFGFSDGQGGSVPFIATLVFFKPTPTSVVRITFTFMQDFEAQIEPDVNSMLQSIRLTK
jgi:hypothetical protein